MLRPFFILVILSGLISCSNNNNTGNAPVSEIRTAPSTKPVASYLVSMGDPKLGRVFGVEVFETPFTYKYLLAMQYDGMQEGDTLYLPQLDTPPSIVVKPGTDSLSCTIGFLDEKKKFNEYKLLTGHNGQLKLKTLKQYYIQTN